MRYRGRPGIGTINDDDSINVFQFSSATASVAEGSGSATITVTRTGDTQAWAASSSRRLTGAPNRKDYAFGYGTILFEPGESSKDLKILITNDVNVKALRRCR
jgi:hypothetical protein